jgi:hypothetical protein
VANTGKFSESATVIFPGGCIFDGHSRQVETPKTAKQHSLFRDRPIPGHVSQKSKRPPGTGSD